MGSVLAVAAPPQAAAPAPRPSRVPFAIVPVAASLLLASFMGYRARTGGGAPSWLLWGGLLLLYVPVAWRILAPGCSRGAQALLVLALGEGLLGTRMLLYPSAFVYHDEIIHRNTLRLIEQDQHLFTPNSLLPVSPYYPGLELATSAVHQVTGLPVHLAGVIVLLAARAVMMLALFRIVEAVSGSSAVAAAAGLVYAANPQFLVFNSLFSYQSLALPLALLTVYLAVVGSRPLPALAAAAATVVTHHLTSMALLAVLVCWWAASRLPWCARVPGLGRLALATLGLVAGWAALAGPRLLPYLGELAERTVTALRTLGRGSDHALFADPAGTGAPLWERAVSVAAVLAICLCLLAAVFTVRRWLPRRNAAAAVLAAVGLAYPLIPAGHLTLATSEVAERSAGFLFVGTGFVLAAWHHRRGGAQPEPGLGGATAAGRPGQARRSRSSRRGAAQDGRAAGASSREDQDHHPPTLSGRPADRARVRPLLAAAVAAVMFTGGTVLGSGPDWLRIPGPYLVEAENRSVDADNVAAAEWLRDHLPPGGRVFTDRANGLLAAAVGRQHTLTSLADRLDLDRTAGLLLDGPRAEDVPVAAAYRVEYLIADARLASSLPHVGVYIDSAEPQASHHASPPPVQALTKFDAVPGAQRVYDNGSDRVYDLRGLW